MSVSRTSSGSCASRGERIAALEVRERGEAALRCPAPLKRRNAERVAGGARRREAIRAILAAHPGPGEMTGKHVRAALEHQSFMPLPALRTVRLHMQRLRGNGNAPVLPPR